MSIVNYIHSGLGSSNLEGTFDTSKISDHHICFVKSVRGYFKLDKSRSDTADGYAIVQPLIGTGRWIRLPEADQLWMQQLTWYIDPINGHDEYDGTSATHTSGLVGPIKTDAERQRRMGSHPIWSAGEYHLRYLNDVAATDTVEIAGFRAANSTIFLHGSAIDGYGKTTLYSGSVNSLTSLNRATNQPYEITSSGLASTWAAANLIDARIRLTSGNALGAKAWAIKDLGTKKARITQFNKKNTYSIPFSASKTSVPASGDISGATFVVESLVKIPNLIFTIKAVDDFSVNFNVEKLCVESLNVGEGNLIFGGNDQVTFDGCWLRLWADNPQSGMQLEIIGCKFTDGLFISNGFNTQIAIYAGYAIPIPGSYAVFVESTGVLSIFDLDFMIQGGYFIFQNKNNVLIGHIAVFDSSISGIVLEFGATFNTSSSIDSGASDPSIWGSGNAQYGIIMSHSCFIRLTSGTFNGSITGSSGNIQYALQSYSWSDIPIRPSFNTGIHKENENNNEAKLSELVASGLTGLLRVVRGVVTSNVSALSSFTVAGNDGITYVAGDRVLLAGQTTGSENGIYKVGTVSSGSAPLTRTVDWVTGLIVGGIIVNSQEGTTWANSQWKVTNTGTITIGSTAITLYPKIIKGTQNLSSGTPSTATVSNLFILTGAIPMATNQTAVTATKATVSAGQGNGSLTLTGGTSVTDTIGYIIQNW